MYDLFILLFFPLSSFIYTWFLRLPLLSKFVPFQLLLGELFSQAQQMFDIDMYKKLLEVVHVAIQDTVTIENATTDAVSYISVFSLSWCPCFAALFFCYSPIQFSFWNQYPLPYSFVFPFWVDTIFCIILTFLL